MVAYKPLRDLVIIQIGDKKSESGIIISEELEEFGTVQAIGNKVKTVKIGDKVIYNKFAGTILEDKHRRILEEKDLFAIVEE